MLGDVAALHVDGGDGLTVLEHGGDGLPGEKGEQEQDAAVAEVGETEVEFIIIVIWEVRRVLS